MNKLIWYFMDKDVVRSTVTLEPNKITLKHEQGVEPFELALDGKTSATLDEYLTFMESRCFDRERPDCDELLSELGMTEYLPDLIAYKTRGRLSSDTNWIKFEGENINWEDIVASTKYKKVRVRLSNSKNGDQL